MKTYVELSWDRTVPKSETAFEMISEARDRMGGDVDIAPSGGGDFRLEGDLSRLLEVITELHHLVHADGIPTCTTEVKITTQRSVSEAVPSMSPVRFDGEPSANVDVPATPVAEEIPPPEDLLVLGASVAPTPETLVRRTLSEATDDR